MVREPWGLSEKEELVQEPSVWVLADDRAGNVAQATGVAEALGWPFVTKSIEYGAAAVLPNLLRGASLMGVSAASRAELTPPWPDVVIAAGRRTAPIARWIKKRSGGSTYLAQIMWPGSLGATAFDLIAVPTHDQLAGTRPNVMRVTGAPHRVTEGRLALEATRWRDRLGGLAQPRVALIVGGSTKNRRFTPDMARDLARRVTELVAQTGGSLMITTSRRTGRDAEDALFEALPRIDHAFRWGDGSASPKDNPYFGYLALADVIIVTGDSVSMASEACATDVPVYLYAPPELISPKHARLHRHLYALGLAEPLTGRFQPWEHPSLNAANDIAKMIRLSLATRGAHEPPADSRGGQGKTDRGPGSGPLSGGRS